MDMSWEGQYVQEEVGGRGLRRVLLLMSTTDKGNELALVCFLRYLVGRAALGLFVTGFGLEGKIRDWTLRGGR